MCHQYIMTRGQKAKQARDAIMSKNDWPDQSKVVEMNSKLKYFTELRFTSAKELTRCRNLNEIKHETKCFCYIPIFNTIFINPASRSQLSLNKFTRELNQFCAQINIKEIYFIKKYDNNIFVERLVKDIQSNKI